MSEQHVTDSPEARPGVGCSDLLCHVPPRGGLCGRPGHQAGISAALREMKIGDERDCPFAWEGGLRSAAERIGIRVVSRRLPKQTGVRVYRVA